MYLNWRYIEIGRSNEILFREKRRRTATGLASTARAIKDRDERSFAF